MTLAVGLRKWRAPTDCFPGNRTPRGTAGQGKIADLPKRRCRDVNAHIGQKWVRSGCGRDGLLGNWRSLDVGAAWARSLSGRLGQTDDEQSVRAVHAGLDAGVNFFDTAANYGAGHSEVVLGKALKGRRDQVVIATKFGHIVNEQEKTVYGDPDQVIPNVRQDVVNSLRRLQTDYIDIYQLHDGGYDPERAAELRDILETLVAGRKIRWYGWSTDLVDRAQIFAAGEHCTSIQFRLNAVFDNPEMRRLCADFDMAGINKDPLNKGILTGKFTTESTFPAPTIFVPVSASKMT